MSDPIIFHTCKISFLLPAPKHTEGEFSIISISPSPAGHTVDAQLVHRGETELHREESVLLPLNTDPPLLPHIQNQSLSSCCKFAWASTQNHYVHYELKEVRSVFCCTGPLALWHFPCPPHLESLPHFLSHKVVLLLLISTAGKRWNISFRAAEQWKSLGKKGLKGIPKLPLKYPDPVVKLFLKISKNFKISFDTIS